MIKDIEKIRKNGDFDNDYFERSKKQFGYDGVLDFYIDGVKTHGICLVNSHNRTAVIEKVTLCDGFRYERVSFDTFAAYNRVPIDGGYQNGVAVVKFDSESESKNELVREWVNCPVEIDLESYINTREFVLGLGK